MIDKQVLSRFKQFQKKTGKYEDFKLENVQFDLMTLDKIAKVPIKGGGTPETSKREYWSDDFSLIDNENYYGWRNIDKDVFALGEIDQYSKVITKEAYASSSTWLVPENSILIAIASASKGLIVINQKPMCTNQNILGVVIKEEFNLKYIFTNLKLLYADLEGKSEYGNLTKGSEEKRIIPIPKSQNEVYTSLKIQEILVEFIEFYQHNTREKLGIIDQISDKIAAAESLLLPLFFLKHPSVSRRFDAFCKQQKIKLKLKDLVFENKKLNELALLTMGQSPEGSDINDSGKGLPFHQGKTGYGEMYLKEATNWTEAGRKIAEKDDILISMRAPAGAINIAPYTTAIGRGLASIRCNADISRTYLYFYLKDNERRIENAGENGGIFTSINRDYLVDFAINVPVQLNDNFTSHYLQQLIVTFIESYFAKMGERKDLTASLKALFSTRNNMIIQKTFKTKDKK